MTAPATCHDTLRTLPSVSPAATARSNRHAPRSPSVHRPPAAEAEIAAELAVHRPDLGPRYAA
ncbi:hypothetical protein ACVNF4_32125, partial [Streptomyces sp. S6]